MFNILFRSTIDSKVKIIIFLTYAFAIMLALTIHEFAHAFVAYKLGDRTAKSYGRLSLNPMVHFDVLGLISFVLFGFGWAKPVPINPYNFRNIKKDTFLVSIAGITANLILTFVFCPLAIILNNAYNATGSMLSLIFSFLFTFIYQINLVLMVFNLIPIYPLDGFNALASQVKYDNSYVAFNRQYGAILLIGLVVLFYYTNIFDYLVYYVGYPITAFWGLFL